MKKRTPSTTSHARSPPSGKSFWSCRWYTRSPVEWTLEFDISPQKSLFSSRSIICDILRPPEGRGKTNLRRCVDAEFFGRHHGHRADLKPRTGPLTKTMLTCHDRIIEIAV